MISWGAVGSLFEKDTQIIDYTGTQQQKQMLLQYADKHLTGVFWPSVEILSSLARPSYQMQFASKGNAWQGILLTQWLHAEAEIIYLHTAEEFRREGIAAALVKCVLAKMASLDIESVFLEVRSSNQAAISLYESFGFNDYGERASYYQDGESARLMKRVL